MKSWDDFVVTGGEQPMMDAKEKAWSWTILGVSVVMMALVMVALG